MFDYLKYFFFLNSFVKRFQVYLIKHPFHDNLQTVVKSNDDILALGSMRGSELQT